MFCDIRNEPTIYASINSEIWGPTVRYSTNMGETWTEAEQDVRFEEGSDRKVKRVWCAIPGGDNHPGVLYAGVDPGAMFKTEDGGKNWSELTGLSNHSTREKWFPGKGGLMVHSICPHPSDSQKIHVGISAAGTFYSEDSGESWQPRNKGVLVDFLPDKFPEVGQCVHHMESHPSKPEVLYQQNHCGCYRSDNGGEEWIDINEGLPSRFGFPLLIHPHDPDTIYVIPEESPEFRCPVNGELAVYRSRNRGENWQKLTNGFPQKNAFLNIYRHAMCADDCDAAGIYFGTSTGQILYSLNDGDSWDMLANWLPPVFSVSAVVL